MTWVVLEWLKKNRWVNWLSSHGTFNWYFAEMKWRAVWLWMGECWYRLMLWWPGLLEGCCLNTVYLSLMILEQRWTIGCLHWSLGSVIQTQTHTQTGWMGLFRGTHDVLQVWDSILSLKITCSQSDWSSLRGGNKSNCLFLSHSLDLYDWVL